MKVGILGMGSIGTRHARNLIAMGHIVISHDPQFDWTEPRDKVIRDSDALIIATPTVQHYQDLTDCLSEAKPVFVEKPIAANKQEWEQLLLLDTGRLFVGYNLRFHPAVRRAKNRLEARQIGDPLYACFILAQKSQKAAYLRDGVILNWSHELDLARHLLGPCDVVWSVVRTDPDEIEADIHLVHHARIRSDVHLNYVTAPQARNFTIVGTEGWFTVNLHDDPNGFEQSYRDEMTAFLNAPVITGATGEDGLAVLKLCLDAKRCGGL